MNGPALRAPTFSESVSIDNYTAAMKGALTSADSISDKIVTAAISVATAYGAAIALVAPKESPAPWVVLLPIGILAAALGLALYAQSIGISIAPDDQLESVEAKISGLIDSKRRWARIALLTLVAGLIAAGAILYENYGPNAEKETTTTLVQLYFTSSGTESIGRACGREVDRMLVRMDDVKQLTEDRVPFKVGRSSCPMATGTLLLPQRAIAIAKH